MLNVKRDVNKITKHNEVDEKELPIQSYEVVEDFLKFDEKYKDPEKLKLLVSSLFTGIRVLLYALISSVK